MDPESVEDILGDSLHFLSNSNGRSPNDDGRLVYGPLTVTVAPKEGKANTLLADHIFSPSLLLAERIERGLIPVKGRTMVELGAGAALPSLVAAARPEPPSLVVVTDYPDDGILGNLKENVKRNVDALGNGAIVRAEGYEWGTSVKNLISLLPVEYRHGYDIVVISDLLHFDRSHDMLLSSLTSLLARTPTSRALVAAGIYTRVDLCQSFLDKAKRAGIAWLEQGGGEDGRELDIVWRGMLQVKGLDCEQLGVRKGMCRWWIGGWGENLVYKMP